MPRTLFLKRLIIPVWMLSLTMAVSVSALDPAYLDEMPSIEQVLADVHGKDPMNTLARQMAALMQLVKVVEDMAGNRRYGGMTPD